MHPASGDGRFLHGAGQSVGLAFHVTVSSGCMGAHCEPCGVPFERKGERELRGATRGSTCPPRGGARRQAREEAAELHHRERSLARKPREGRRAISERDPLKIERHTLPPRHLGQRFGHAREAARRRRYTHGLRALQRHGAREAARDSRREVPREGGAEEHQPKRAHAERGRYPHKRQQRQREGQGNLVCREAHGAPPSEALRRARVRGLYPARGLQGLLPLDPARWREGTGARVPRRRGRDKAHMRADRRAGRRPRPHPRLRDQPDARRGLSEPHRPLRGRVLRRGGIRALHGRLLRDTHLEGALAARARVHRGH